MGSPSNFLQEILNLTNIYLTCDAVVQDYPYTNKITHELEQGLGVEGSKKLHMWFLPGQERSEIKGKKDNTHYNIYGAQVIANLLADGICEEIPELKKYRKYNSSK